VGVINTRSFRHLGGGRKGLFLMLRYMFIIAASYLLLFQAPEGPASPTVATMIAVALASNVVFSLTPAQYLFSWYFEAPILVADTLWVSWALHSTGAAGQEFFLLYFFVLFFAMLGENLPLLLLGSTLVSAANVWLAPTPIMWSSGNLLRIVFFYMVALFYGHVLGRIRHERERAERGLAWARELEAKVAERTKELQYLYDQSQEASRLKSEFVANMSHELRTPLHIIIGYGDILLDDDLARGERVRLIQGVRQASRSLLELVNGVLDLRKLEAGRMPVVLQPVALDRFMSEFRKRERMPLPAEVRLVWEIAPYLPAIETDPSKLTVILDNLVNNAIKFTSAGTITVSARFDRDLRRVVFHVADTGTGIAAEHQAAIFEPFHRIEGTADRSYAGAGLGLAIVRRYVTLLGGDITVRSEPGVGTTFELSLASRPAPTEHERRPSTARHGDRRAA
jgi:signal transduction histidine kinase